MNIAVYLGANEGNDPALATAVQELGRWIGESGNRLVYGGRKLFSMPKPLRLLCDVFLRHNLQNRNNFRYL